uniref:Integrase, catalytic region, zinc finger, CCHC-type, peptidase aspartic, catalytic n=1 Tax=Tanacetum cinerariifolium TaxID=118510 RepID=A0A6L2MQD2_TANCI|nr:integrase, catalytic region, zinc finger, CCHC-type, peptidase aspartic, catalytic [Tanacetum cinerariifolium]
MYKNAKLRTQLFKKVSDQKDNTHDTSVNTKFAKQPIVENLPNVGETHALSKPVTLNLVSTPQESKGVNNDKTTLRPEDHNLGAIQRMIGSPLHLRVVEASIKKLKKHKANVSIKEKQKKHHPHVKKPKKVGFLERLATPKPRKPRFLLRWSPTSRLFDQKGKIVNSSESESQSDCSNGDNADIGKLGAKGDIGFFIGYSTDSCAYRIYNRRTKKIMETMNVSFDELSAMAFEQRISKPWLQSMTSRQISSGLDLTYAPSTITTQQPTEGELDLLFEAMYDDYIGGPAQEPQVRQTSTASTSIADTTSTPTNSSSHATNIPITS